MKDFRKRLLSVFVIALFAVSTTQVFAKAPIPQCNSNGCNAIGNANECTVLNACLMVPITVGWKCSCIASPAGSPNPCYCFLKKL